MLLLDTGAICRRRTCICRAETDSSLRDTLTSIHYNGTVLWVPHQKLKSSCSIDVTNFPFDRQKCHMWFGSWTYTKEDLNLSLAFNDGS